VRTWQCLSERVFFSRMGRQGRVAEEGRRLQAGQSKGSRTREEIAAAIRGLSPADGLRLRKVATLYSAGRPITIDDLLQEAFARALDGRSCPPDVEVVRFLAEAMRSIAHGEQEKVGNRLVLVSADGTDANAMEAYAVPDPSPGAESRIIGEEQAEEIRVAILALFDGDEVAQVIVEGMMEELEGEELRELCGLDETAYNSKRRLIRRRIDSAYPKGWQP
jgi:DNA-directed RNA polymerase specialized sigma24 family protein